MNVDNKGYAKFLYSERDIQAFEKKLGKIADRDTRKMVIL